MALINGSLINDTLVNPLASDAAFRVPEAARVLTPALIIDRDRVQHNIATTLHLLAGDTNRWRPHVKTAKLGYVMRMLADAGVQQFKCSTSLELSVACQAGAHDVLVAYPLIGANAARVRQIAEQHRSVAISVLIENESQIAQWRGTPVSLFVDVNPGMNRTGVPDDHADAILRLCQSVIASGLRFRGLHYYDGHLSKYAIAERCEKAHQGYGRLMHIVDTLATHGLEVPEVITAGTPAFPCSLSFPQFSNAPFVHRVSPGTVVYCDTTSLAQLPPEYGYLPAAVVMTRVVSHPAPGMITCDAGHKTVSADAGVPTCVVLGHPALEPLTPSEEHLPMRVNPSPPKPRDPQPSLPTPGTPPSQLAKTGQAGNPGPGALGPGTPRANGAPVPAIGDLLFLVPRHVCPTVNNFDDAVIVSGGNLVAVEPVSARGREHPIQI
jgi:D-serine deaminase-like pyridoxal phosphate-dependent protein